jgi:hypothetical protein
VGFQQKPALTRPEAPMTPLYFILALNGNQLNHAKSEKSIVFRAEL